MKNQLASSDGSIFSSDITAFEGGLFTIDVVGNGDLEFVVQPSTTVINLSMAPAVRVANTDNNGNIDLASAGEVISITSTGTLISSPITNSIGPAGFANFNTIQHSALGFGLTLTAAATGFTDAISSEFNIVFVRHFTSFLKLRLLATQTKDLLNYLIWGLRILISQKKHIICIMLLVLISLVLN